MSEASAAVSKRAQKKSKKEGTSTAVTSTSPAPPVTGGALNGDEPVLNGDDSQESSYIKDLQR